VGVGEEPVEVGPEDVRRELGELEGEAPVPVGVVVAPEPVLVGEDAEGDPDPDPDATTPLPTELIGVQDDEDGAGCAEGVTGSPW